jgi:PhnB protein
MPETGGAAKAQTMTCYLVVKDGRRALDFYARAFGARELFRLTEPGGKIGHAEMALGESTFMLAEEYPDFGALSPVSIGGSPVKFNVAVADADLALKRAVDAGATVLRPVTNEFYGSRTGAVVDPFGYTWFVAQQVEDVSPEEMQRRFERALT